MSKLDEIEAAVAACDRLDWRIYWCEETEQWEAWFHPEWDADPNAVVRVVLADDLPSKNEFACMAALQHMLANAPALLRVARAAAEYKQTNDAWMRDEIKGLAPTVLNEAEDRLFAALAALESEAPK